MTRWFFVLPASFAGLLAGCTVTVAPAAPGPAGERRFTLSGPYHNVYSAQLDALADAARRACPSGAWQREREVYRDWTVTWDISCLDQ
jgi:hypothetical protein